MQSAGNLPLLMDALNESARTGEVQDPECPSRSLKTQSFGRQEGAGPAPTRRRRHPHLATATACPTATVFLAESLRSWHRGGWREDATDMLLAEAWSMLGKRLSQPSY